MSFALFGMGWAVSVAVLHALIDVIAPPLIFRTYGHHLACGAGDREPYA
jgi:hypothetical protein